MDVSQRGEFGLIAQLHRNLAQRRGVRLGIGDDAAVLEALAHPIVTADALVEGVHFRRDWTSARALGAKAMAVNLSDLAAMGARPVAAFVTLALPPDCQIEWVENLYAGMESMAARHEFTVAGGDTTAAPLAFISIALVGDLMDEARGLPVMRSGAQVGDLICVSGDVGDSAAGLAVLQNPQTELDEAARAFLLHRHLEPTPRLEWMRELLQSDRESVHAALDISDGLAGDAPHIACASGVDIEIDADQLPISEACRAAGRALQKSPLDWALAGGEDYELCLSVAPALAQNARDLTVVGRVVAGSGAVRIWENGVERAAGAGWRHF